MNWMYAYACMSSFPTLELLKHGEGGGLHPHHEVLVLAQREALVQASAFNLGSVG